MQYSEKVMDHFMNPRNVGKLEHPDAEATEGSPACGDQITVQLKIDENSHVIEDIKFLSYGCASNIATGSIITEMAKGKTIEDAEGISWKQAADELDGLPPVKMHCSVLAVDTLRKAIKSYKINHGMAEADKFSKDLLIEELKKVIYGGKGEDIITLKMVKYLGFENGVVTIDVDIPKFDTYRDNLAEEIEEHLSQFDEVKEVKITM